MQAQTVEQTDNAPRQAFSRDGHTYKNRAEYMKYLMRRRRNADLPHYPDCDPNRS